MAPTIEVGDPVPEGTFTLFNSFALADTSQCHTTTEIPELDSHAACGVPTKLDINKECLKPKDIAVFTTNDAFVMSGWGRFEGLKDKTLSDPNVEWSGKMGLSVDLSAVTFGTRTIRYAMIIDDLVVKYVAAEPGKGEVTVSGVDVVLSHL
ncbi:1-Cys peroxiredoxin isozyme [Lentinula aciculospora]|uniref:1-Cys peroxiredoxin isozyme n=1 Tax=Lentinula aciculospora TaxID=153920 RepID=A0A9W8ZVU5_9AGAR|nr:1-Cys peroxiredoxin isozyme [Lentinula aciculospora]